MPLANPSINRVDEEMLTFNVKSVQVNPLDLLEPEDHVLLEPGDKELLSLVEADLNRNEILLFLRLRPHFLGKRHMEDIMYYENVRRADVMALLEKFEKVLFACFYEDTAVSLLCPYSNFSNGYSNF